MIAAAARNPRLCRPISRTRYSALDWCCGAAEIDARVGSVGLARGGRFARLGPDGRVADDLVARREQAHEHLTTATTLYREMDMRFWLQQADAGMGA